MFLQLCKRKTRVKKCGMNFWALLLIREANKNVLKSRWKKIEEYLRLYANHRTFLRCLIILKTFKDGEQKKMDDKRWLSNMANWKMLEKFQGVENNLNFKKRTKCFHDFLKHKHNTLKVLMKFCNAEENFWNIWKSRKITFKLSICNILWDLKPHQRYLKSIKASTLSTWSIVELSNCQESFLLPIWSFEVYLCFKEFKNKYFKSLFFDVKLFTALIFLENFFLPKLPSELLIKNIFLQLHKKIKLFLFFL